ncbi:RNA-binding domain-containing protein [Halobacillus litoralis]|uniref:RNA-binding domain-containing protein n=1 Tax=Halobacillus litoralis TaxID=45668 RepID=UPI00136BFDE6|nr:RNA-binding domain-containing protein [Halobacillus litoralis]MYL39050.1 hypothetical protein [Halobacillus litoralis]
MHSIYREKFAAVLENAHRENFLDLVDENMEDNNLDFKETWIKNAELAKIMLGMGNIGGGLIIIGVKEVENNRMEPIGLETTYDRSQLYNKVEKFIPSSFDFHTIAFEYPEKGYEERVNGKSFQLIKIEKQDENLPLVATSSSGNTIIAGHIYIR